ncbi:MAG: deoxyribodipyrimidine photo-lyase [Coxiellaceae bacterium]|nr:deoxyribodipyrimidine photo-lyase [Coxiellaceae bacterium]
MIKGIFWFRQDLRLSDNEALVEAARFSDDLIPIYIFDDMKQRPMGAAQRWWLHYSLCSLSEALKKKGVTLILKRGDPKNILLDLVKKNKIDAVYWNSVYEPEALKSEKAIESSLSDLCDINIYNGNLLTDPDRIKNKSGTCFKVYTPYWRSLVSQLKPRRLLLAPKAMTQKSKIASDDLKSWQLLPSKPDWSVGFKDWSPGEVGAKKALKQFLDDGLEDYSEHRDRPDLLGTSRLSPHLHFGELSPWQVWNAAMELKTAQAAFRNGAEVFLKQLVWREFSYYLLFHFPNIDKKNFNSKFDGFKWQQNKKQLQAWKKGLTGFPIVDAGMRQLWQTGYMHNRVRMIVASFLTKDLLIHWHEGEAWFWDTLLDADLANNIAGWQWVAGCGADAAPYFRIFNPTLQGEKFDPEGNYVRQWVPELAELPKKYIHDPSSAPAEVLQAAGVKLGEDYPQPIVDHKAARDEALARYKKIR